MREIKPSGFSQGKTLFEEKGKGITRAKKAVQEVVLPKIPLGEERVYLQSLVAEL